MIARLRSRPVFPGTCAGLLALVLALVPLAGVAAGPDWQPIGRAGGVEAYSAQTADGSVRILFRNTNEHGVAIRMDRALIWCGSSERGEGVPVEADIGSFSLAPAQSRSPPGWGGTCRAPEYFVEFRGMTIENRD